MRVFLIPGEKTMKTIIKTNSWNIWNSESWNGNWECSFSWNGDLYISFSWNGDYWKSGSWNGDWYWSGSWNGNWNCSILDIF